MTTRLHPDAIVVWWMTVASPCQATLARWRANLESAEQARADRFRDAADRETWTAAHALKRALLASATAVPAAAWRFVAGVHGKPAIDPQLNHPRLRFNLSHTRGLVVCALGLDFDMGVDVESFAEDRAVLEIAESCFAPAELALLRGSEPARQSETFTRLWTLKEAYIKATGRGLNCPLDGFAFALAPIGIRFHSDVADDPNDWQFAQWRLTSDRVIALARHAPMAGPLTIEVHEITPAAL